MFKKVIDNVLRTFGALFIAGIVLSSIVSAKRKQKVRANDGEEWVEDPLLTE